MTKLPTAEATGDLPVQVFETFLQNLAAAGASAELIARLRKTLLVDREFTERALKNTVLSEEPQA